MEDFGFQFQGMDFDMKAYERMFLRLIDVHRFGDWRIFLDEGRVIAVRPPFH